MTHIKPEVNQDKVKKTSTKKVNFLQKFHLSSTEYHINAYIKHIITEGIWKNLR